MYTKLVCIMKAITNTIYALTEIYIYSFVHYESFLPNANKKRPPDIAI